MNNQELTSISKETFRQLQDIKEQIKDFSEKLKQADQRLTILNNGVELDYHILTEEIQNLHIRLTKVEDGSTNSTN